MLFQWWRKVEDSGGLSTFYRGIVIPNHKPFNPKPLYPRYGAYDTPDMMVCKALNTAPKMCRNVIKL